jgi:hypothetical protein
MACTTYSICATEGGSIVIVAAFTDEDGNSVVPNSVTWTLTDGGGTVINSREDIVVTPDVSVDIILSGDDLPWSGSYPTDDNTLYMLIQSEYDSTLGSNIPQNQEVEITVKNLRGVS